MRGKLLLLAITTVLACVTAATGLAAGSTQVEHFSVTHPTNVCGFSGTVGPSKQTSPAVIDEQAGTVTIMTTYGGLFVKFSITRGPTLTRDAGIVTLVDVFEYTGDPNNPVGDLISETLSGLHGPHPDLLSDFSVSCDVLVPYLQDP